MSLSGCSVVLRIDTLYDPAATEADSFDYYFAVLILSSVVFPGS